MAQMNVDDLVKLLDSFSQKGGASIKPQFDGDKANFVVGNGETLSTGLKSSVELCAELSYVSLTYCNESVIVTLLIIKGGNL